MKHRIFFLFLFASAVIQAQVTGIVFDVETKEPLQYATIYCKAEGTGTVSNREGRFALFLKNPESEVSISYMGYNTITKKLSSTNEIPLKRATIMLAEHTVTPIEDVKKILIAADRQYRKNHHVNKTICDIHLKQYELSDGKYISAIDMIGELEIPVAKDLKKEKMFRLSAVSADLYRDTTAIIFSSPPNGIFPVFTNPSTIVYLLRLLTNKYDFHTTQIYQDNAVVYKIDFSYKKEKKNTNQVSGTIFIDKETKAILELRTHQDKSFIKEKQYKYNDEKFLFKNQDLEMIIRYQKMDNGEYLMSYAILYSIDSMNGKQLKNNIVLSNTNFNKSNFNNEHPIDVSRDLGYQLSKMNLTKLSEFNRIVLTKEEAEFFEKNK